MCATVNNVVATNIYKSSPENAKLVQTRKPKKGKPVIELTLPQKWNSIISVEKDNVNASGTPKTATRRVHLPPRMALIPSCALCTTV